MSLLWLEPCWKTAPSSGADYFTIGHYVELRHAAANAANDLPRGFRSGCVGAAMSQNGAACVIARPTAERLGVNTCAHALPATGGSPGLP